VNDIIRAYQIVTRDIFNNGIINQLTWNQFTCSLRFEEIDQNGKFMGDPETFYILVGLSDGPIDKTKYEEIKSLTESPGLMSKRALDEILIQARIFQEQHNFRMTILESVIALEFALNSIVRNSARMKGHS
jgi:predicted Holliday junction resolvase-like endonuclease